MTLRLDDYDPTLDLSSEEQAKIDELAQLPPLLLDLYFGRHMIAVAAVTTFLLLVAIFSRQ